MEKGKGGVVGDVRGVVMGGKLSARDGCRLLWLAPRAFLLDKRSTKLIFE